MNSAVFATGGFSVLGGFLLFIISMMIVDDVWGGWENFWFATALLGLGTCVGSILGMAGYLGYHTF